MKILVTGMTGQVGNAVCRELEKRNIPYLGVNSATFQLTNHDAMKDCVLGYCPDAVIHCAAFTKVDAAQEDPITCNAVNHTATQNLAALCDQLGAKLLYVSTDYVFPGNGDRFYETDDATDPLNCYGASKLAGERAVRAAVREHFILRTSWVFGQGHNFVRTMLNLGKTGNTLRVVCDQVGSPTFADDLAVLICDMIQTQRYGTYHATNEGVCSWYDLAAETFRLAGLDAPLIPVTTAQYPSKAARPLNSRLSKSSLDQNGFARLPTWQDALGRYLEQCRQQGVL